MFPNEPNDGNDANRSNDAEGTRDSFDASGVPSVGSDQNKNRSQPNKAVGANVQPRKITQPDDIHPPEPAVPTVPRYDTAEEQHRASNPDYARTHGNIDQNKINKDGDDGSN